MRSTDIIETFHEEHCGVSIFSLTHGDKTMAKSKKEAKVEIRDLNDEQRKRLSDGLNNAVVQLTFIDDTKASYTDFINSLSDELGIDASDIKQAAQRIYKGDYFDKQNKLDNIETILSVTNNLPQADDY